MPKAFFYERIEMLFQMFKVKKYTFGHTHNV